MFKKIFEREGYYLNVTNYEMVKAILKKKPNAVIELDGDRHLYKIHTRASKFDAFIMRPVFKLFGKVYYKLFPDQEWI